MNAAIAHPGWCDRRRCFETDGDIQHCSELVSVWTQDARLSLALVRADEVDTDDPGETELRLDIPGSTPGSGTQLYLTPSEACQLVERLKGLCWRERYQRATTRGRGRGGAR